MIADIIIGAALVLIGVCMACGRPLKIEFTQHVIQPPVPPEPELSKEDKVALKQNNDMTQAINRLNNIMLGRDDEEVEHNGSDE